MRALSLCVLLLGLLLTTHAAPAPPEKHGGSDVKCPLTVKILDAVNGTPAGPMTLKVFRRGTDDTWALVASGLTEESGEIHNLITEEQFTAGVYKVEFGTKAYWKSKNVTAFHEVADVVFEAHADGHRHYTLALLLSPFSFTTTALTMDANH